MQRMHLITFLLLMVVGSGIAAAGNLQVTPVGFELEPPAASTLTVANRGGASTWLQVRAFAWTQENGEDVLRETADVLVSPPVAQVAPGAEQLFRIVATGVTGASVAQANYRLLVDELPDEPAGEGQSVRVLLRYSLPLSITPADVLPAQLEAVLEAGTRPMLRVSNHGGRRAALADVRLLAGDAAAYPVGQGGLLGHVLPGSTRRWPVELPEGAADVALRLEFMRDGQRQQLPVSRP